MQLISNRYKNSNGILDPFKHGDSNILIVGAGGIGSSVAVVLAKMGMHNITVVDFDTVEEHNLQSQFYRIQDIDKPKVDALAEIVMEQSGVQINTINGAFEPSMAIGRDVVFTLVDDNDIRKEIVESCRGVSHIIDCRMAGTFFEIYNTSFEERDQYFDTFWFPQSEATEVVCSAKSSCFNCFAVAGFACSILRKRLNSTSVDNMPPVMVAMDLNKYIFDWTE